MTSLPADLSSSSPCFILTSSQPKGASAVLVNSFPLFANSGFTFITISAASCKFALHPMFIGARSNFPHSSSNLPGFGVAVLVIRLLVDSSVYANCVYRITAAFLPTKHGSIVSENFAILLSFVSKALNLGVCTAESAPSNILVIRENLVIPLAASYSRPAFCFLSHFMVRGYQSRNSRYFPIRLVIRPQVPEFREHFKISSVYFTHSVTEMIVKVFCCHLWLQYLREQQIFAHQFSQPTLLTPIECAPIHC